MSRQRAVSVDQRATGRQKDLDWRRFRLPASTRAEGKRAVKNTRFKRADALWAILAGLSTQRRNSPATWAWRILLVGFLCGLPLHFSVAQGERGRVDAASLQRLPSTLQRHANALGSRAKEKDKEETELAGTFTDETGKSVQARVVYQLSGEVVLEGFKEKKTVAFDGRDSFGESDRLDQVLLETFALDTVEGMFVSLGAGAALQILGFGFGPDSRTYSGPRYDIYDVTIPTRTRRDKALRTRRYYFDSESAVLLRTRYVDSTVRRGLQVETRFSDWRTVNGSLYPGRIERFEDGRLLFSFQPAAIRNGPRTVQGNGSN